MSNMNRSESDAVARQDSQGNEAINIGLLFLMAAVGMRVTRFQRMSIFGFERGTGIWNFSIFKIVMLLCGASLAAYLLTRPRARAIRVDLPLKLLGGYFIWELMTFFWALYPAHVIPEAARTLFKVTIYALIITLTVSWGDIRRWGHLLMYMSFGFLGTAYHEGVVVGWFRAARLWGGTRYPGICANWSTFIMPFNLHYAAWGENHYERNLGIAGIVANLVTVYITTRRAALVVLPIVFLLYMVLIGHRRKWLLFALLIIATLMPIYIMRNPEYSRRVELTMLIAGGDAVAVEREDAGRMAQYIGGLEAAHQYWPLGMGVGGFKWWVQDYYGYFAEITLHNLPLHLIVQTGVLGFLLFGGYLYIGLSQLWTSYRYLINKKSIARASLAAAMLTALVGNLAYSFFQPIHHEIPMYLAIALGSIMLGLLRKEQTAEKAADTASEEAAGGAAT